MAYVTIPKDLDKVKNKVVLNLTLRQIICFGIGAAIGIPVYFSMKRVIGSSSAATAMVLIMLPAFLFAMYERDGMPLEKILKNIIRVHYIRPAVRNFESNRNKKSGMDKKAGGDAGEEQETADRRESERRRLPWQKIEKMSAQESIPYEQMTRDGIAKVRDNYYSMTIRFEEANYQLAQPDEKSAIFENWCDFLNYFDNTIPFQLTFLNRHGGMKEFQEIVRIASKNDHLNDVRREYGGMLKRQLEKGNNGLVRTKYITFGVEAENYKKAKLKLSRIESDVLNNFKAVGVSARTLNREERLRLMYESFHPGQGEEFSFSPGKMRKEALSTKDFVAPKGFAFDNGRDFQIRNTYGTFYGAASYLQITAPEISDKMFADFLELDLEMDVTIHISSVEQAEAVKMVKKKITDLDGMTIDEQKKAVRSGYDIEIIPSDLMTYGEDAKKLLKDIQTRNERMFRVTISFINKEKNRQDLENAVLQISGVAQKYNCSLKRLDHMQEEAVMSALPLAYDTVPIRKRWLTTTSTAIFIPFTTQELFMGGDSVYYGLNAVSNNMIMADRKQLKNPNGIITGTPGSGKSFSGKREITNVVLITDDDVIVSDPEGEYAPLITALGGRVIHIAANSRDYVNPMDINMNYAEEDNPLAMKSDFVLSLYELIIGARDGIDPEERSVIDRCLPLVYLKYFEDPVPENMPILGDLYDCLLKQREPQAKRIATALEIYVNGSLNVFNHRTNVALDNRIICFDIKGLGKQLKKLGMLIVHDQVWNRVTLNREAHKSTRYYMDEFHLLLKEEQTAAYSVEIWKRFRKWGGIPTGLTQNIKDLFASPEIENILENSDFIYMLNQASGDRQILAKHLNISPQQLSYVTNSGEGEGLIFFGNTIIPFADHFDRSLQLYRLMTTKPDEVKERDEEMREEIRLEKRRGQVL